jgi:hypothetical protein
LGGDLYVGLLNFNAVVCGLKCEMCGSIGDRKEIQEKKIKHEKRKKMKKGNQI